MKTQPQKKFLAVIISGIVGMTGAGLATAGVCETGGVFGGCVDSYTGTPERAGGMDSAGLDPYGLREWTASIDALGLTATVDPGAIIGAVESRIYGYYGAERQATLLEDGVVTLNQTIDAANTNTDFADKYAGYATNFNQLAAPKTASASDVTAVALSDTAEARAKSAAAGLKAEESNAIANPVSQRASEARASSLAARDRADSIDARATGTSSTFGRAGFQALVNHNTDTVDTTAVTDAASATGIAASTKSAVATAKSTVSVAKAVIGKASANSGYDRSEATIISAVRGRDGRTMDAGSVYETMEAEEMQTVNFEPNNFEVEGVSGGAGGIVKLFSHKVGPKGQLSAISSAYDGTYDLVLSVYEEYDGESRLDLYIDDVLIERKVIQLCEKRRDGTYPTQEDARPQFEYERDNKLTSTIENMGTLTFFNVKVGYGSTVRIDADTDNFKTFARIDKIEFTNKR